MSIECRNQLRDLQIQGCVAIAELKASGGSDNDAAIDIVLNMVFGLGNLKNQPAHLAERKTKSLIMGGEGEGSPNALVAMRQ